MPKSTLKSKREKVRTQNFLLEIGCEELPASFIEPALSFMKETFSNLLSENYLTASEVKTYGTPRRLILFAFDVPERQEDREELIVGPSARAAYDEKGNPTRAAEGFARSKGASVNELIKVENPPGRKGIYVAIRRVVKGRQTAEVLSEILPHLILSIPFKKSMRWGTKSIRFGRPIRWILSLFGNQTVQFEVDGIRSGRTSYGNRLLSPSSFEVESVESFLEELEERYVVADPEKRKAIIWDISESLAASVDGKLIEDEELLEEVINLVEYPYPILGSFEKEFLELPKEVPITVMKDHQKFFSIVDESGNLTNHFIGVANLKPVDDTTVRLGYERVLRARLSDALFFYNEDKKKPLEERVPALKGIVFHEKLGTMLDKTERLESLAPFISSELGLNVREKATRAAHLCKADLLTEMVNEFPELQGTMGKYYALLHGEDEEVALAIEEHYFPRFSGDKVAETQTGISLSIAEKIDNLVGFIGAGLKPTGSADPFALRRNALGLIQTLLENKLHLNLTSALNEAASLYRNMGIKLSTGAAEETLSFIKERLKVLMRERGFRADTVEAVLSATDDVYDAVLRAEAIDALRASEEFEEVLITMRRVINIIPARFEAKPFTPEGEFEEKLFFAFEDLKEELSKLLKSRNYTEALLKIKELKPYVDAFFDNVMVMDKDENIKNRRLSLLKTISDTLLKVADFSKIGF